MNTLNNKDFKLRKKKKKLNCYEMVRTGLVLVISRAYLHMVPILKMLSLGSHVGRRKQQEYENISCHVLYDKAQKYVLSATFCWSEQIEVQTKFKETKKTNKKKTNS